MCLKSELLPIAIEILKKEIMMNKGNFKLRLLGKNILCFHLLYLNSLSIFKLFFFAGVGLSKLTKNSEENEKKSILGYFKTQENKIKLPPDSDKSEMQDQINKAESEDICVQSTSNTNDNTKNKPVIGFFKARENKAEQANLMKAMKSVKEAEIITQKDDKKLCETNVIPESDDEDDSNVVFPSVEDVENDEEKEASEVEIIENDEIILNDGDTNFLDTDSKTETFTCPSCNNMKFSSLPVLNAHLDKCISTLKPDLGSEDSNSNSMEISISTNYIVCPVCNGTFNREDMSLTKFNTHVDGCLNRQTIKELVQTERRTSLRTNDSKSVRRKSSDTRPAKKQKVDKSQYRISDFFNNNKK